CSRSGAVAGALSMREPSRRALLIGSAGIALLLGSAPIAAGRAWAGQQIAVAVMAGSEHLMPVAEEAYFEGPLFARDRETTAQVRLAFETMHPISQPLTRSVFYIQRDDVMSGSSGFYSERGVDDAPNNEIHLDLTPTNDGAARSIAIAVSVEIK